MSMMMDDADQELRNLVNAFNNQLQSLSKAVEELNERVWWLEVTRENGEED